jgi:predicted phosphodiesterase
LDPDEFEISNIISNEWSMTNSAGEQHWNYQSKISAKPKSDEITVFEQIEQAIQKYVKPFDISNTEDETIDENLTIPFYDLHFSQSNTAYDYQTYQERIMQYLENDYNEVVIILGGDLLNANDFHSQTIHQTRVEDTDMTSAWEEATLFLCPIIEKALATSPNVRVVYLRGNHDESMSWAFVKYLEARYPQCEYDDSVKQLKATLVDDVVFFSTHGHIRKNLKDLVALCSAVYPQEWAKAKRRFLLTGHKHFDKQEDLPGITCIQVTTPSKATVYEEENMYLGTQNGMRLIETSGSEMTALYYL